MKLWRGIQNITVDTKKCDPDIVLEVENQGRVHEPKQLSETFCDYFAKMAKNPLDLKAAKRLS